MRLYDPRHKAATLALATGVSAKGGSLLLT